VADVRRRIGLSLGADLCWPICYEEVLRRLDLALEIGREAGVPLPATGLTQSILTSARALGLGDYDFAVVFDVLARLAGLPPSDKA